MTIPWFGSWTGPTTGGRCVYSVLQPQAFDSHLCFQNDNRSVCVCVWVYRITVCHFRRTTIIS